MLIGPLHRLQDIKILLPPTDEVWSKVMLHLSVCSQGVCLQGGLHPGRLPTGTLQDLLIETVYKAIKTFVNRMSLCSLFI